MFSWFPIIFNTTNYFQLGLIGLYSFMGFCNFVFCYKFLWSVRSYYYWSLINFVAQASSVILYRVQYLWWPTIFLLSHLQSRHIHKTFYLIRFASCETSLIFSYGSTKLMHIWAYIKNPIICSWHLKSQISQFKKHWRGP